jgi:3D (Asp-Asp-Asp) domain-containing protein
MCFGLILGLTANANNTIVKNEDEVIVETKEKTKTKEKDKKKKVVIEDIVIEDITDVEEVMSIDKEDIEEAIEKKEKREEAKKPKLVSLGTFKLTAYCNCSKCCGKWAGSKTASGTTPTAGRTIAVDTSVIPFGTKVVINGNTYTAEDTGSAIKGNKIDVYFDSHQSALNFGRQSAEVFVYK